MTITAHQLFSASFGDVGYNMELGTINAIVDLTNPDSYPSTVYPTMTVYDAANDDNVATVSKTSGVTVSGGETRSINFSISEFDLRYTPENVYVVVDVTTPGSGSLVEITSDSFYVGGDGANGGGDGGTAPPDDGGNGGTTPPDDGGNGGTTAPTPYIETVYAPQTITPGQSIEIEADAITSPSEQATVTFTVTIDGQQAGQSTETIAGANQPDLIGTTVTVPQSVSGSATICAGVE